MALPVPYTAPTDPHDGMVGGIDRNMQALHAIERSWSLPALPDMVKLDIAVMSGLDPQGITEFAYGLDGDVMNAQTAPAVVDMSNTELTSGTLPEVTPPQDPEGPWPGMPDSRQFLRGLSNLGPPIDIEGADSVKAFKERAVRLGYLNARDVTMDNRWDPALNGITWDMSMDTFNRRKSGDHPGPGSSIEEVGEFFYRWLSPSGLMSAATGLGLWWDADRISQQTEDWDPIGSLQKWWDDPGDFKHLWRTLGPVDDILMPAINIALLATGIGEVMAFTRATAMATNMARQAGVGYSGLRAWQVANGTSKWQYIDEITGATKLGGALAGQTRVGRMLGASRNVGADMQRMARPGLLGGRLPAAKGGDMMAGWRNLRGVMVGKKAVQQGMRIGFVSRVEQRAGFESSYSIEQMAPDAVKKYNDVLENPFVWTVGEVMFTPYNVLQPGAIKNTVGKPFGYIKNWSKVADHSYYADEFVEATRKHIVMTHQADGPEMVAAKLKDWSQSVKKLGAKQALANRYTGGSAEKLGAWVTFQTITAAITAEAQTLTATVRKGAEAYLHSAHRYDESFHFAKNTLIHQLRYIDPDDITTYFQVMAASRAKTTAGAHKLFESMMNTYNGSASAQARIAKHIEGHNAARMQVFSRLMGRHMEPGLIANSLTDGLMSVGHWDEFVEGSDMVRTATLSGGLDAAHYAPVHSPATGQRVGTRRGQITPTESIFDVSDTEHWLFDYMDIITDPEFVDFAEEAAQAGGRVQGMFSATQRAFPKHGRYTMAKEGTKLFQDKAAELSVVGYLNSARAAVRSIAGKPGNRKIWDKALARATTEGGFESISEVKFGQILAEMNVENVAAHGAPLLNADEIRRFKRIQRYVKKQGIEIGEETVGTLAGAPPTSGSYLSNMDAHIAGRLDEISRSPRWALDYGIDSTLPLEGKVKALQGQMHFSAVEVALSTVPKELADYVTANGYKLAHGTEFASPSDFLELMVEISDVVDKTKYMRHFGAVPARIIRAGEEWGVKAVRGIGRSVQRFEPDYVTSAYRAQLRSSLHRHLLGHEGARTFADPQSADLEGILDVLGRVAGDLKTEGIALHKTKGSMARFSPGRALLNVRTSFTPATPADLVRTPWVWKNAVDKLKDSAYMAGKALSDDELVRIYRGLKGARTIGRTVRGTPVAAMDKLQASPVLTNALRLFGRTVVGQQIASRPLRLAQKGRSLATRATFTAGSGAAGTLGYYQFNPEQGNPLSGDDVTPTGFIAALSAAVGGRMAGGKFVASAPRWLGGFKHTGVQTGTAMMSGSMWASKTPDQLNRLQRALKTATAPIQTGARAIDASVSRQHWAFMFDDLATLRDYFRFSLSPIFDLSRYTEGMVLAQIGDVPESVIARGGLRWNISPSKWRKTRAKELAGKGNKVTDGHKATAMTEWDQVVNDFGSQAMKRMDFDFDALEAGTARFRQVGIAGFNTTEWMASMYADLTLIHGVNKAKAYEIARSAFTYGTKPRSAAEMTVNAVFFPFSFMKKSAGHAAKFLSQDWSRAALMHDAVRAYQLLDDEYDLNQMWKDHIPLLHRFQRLNIFAYGITPGEFGGAIRPLIDFWNSTPMAAGTTDQMQNYALMAGRNTGIFNLFMPQAVGVTVASEQGIANYEKLTRRLLPLYNDMAGLMEDARSQGHVLFGGSGRTAEAEATLGFALIQEKKRNIDMRIRAAYPNSTGIDMLSSFPALEQELREFRGEIEDQYAGYREAYYDDVVFNAITRDHEYDRHRGAFRQWKEANPDVFGGIPEAHSTDGEGRSLRMGYLIDRVENLKARYRKFDYIPIEDIERILDLAGEWAQDDAVFKNKYWQFLRRTFGPIETVRD